MDVAAAFIYFALIAAVLALLGAGTARFARAMGEPTFWPWFWFGCFFGVPAVIVILLRAAHRRSHPSVVSAGETMDSPQPQSVERASSKRCPDCAETVLGEARVCKHCGFRFSGEHPQSKID